MVVVAVIGTGAEELDQSGAGGFGCGSSVRVIAAEPSTTGVPVAINTASR